MGFLDRWSGAPHHDPVVPRTESDLDRQVSEPRRIAHILLRLRDARELLSARIPGSDATFLTTLLGVDTGAQRFHLDELSPRSGHEALLRERTLRLASRLDGVSVIFSATLASVGVERGIAVYALPFPHVLHYHQRRTGYRVGIGAAQHTTVHLGHPEAGPLTGEVRDLSAGGLAVRVQLPDAIVLDQGERLADCAVVLPGGRSLRCDLEVRHVLRLEGSRWTRLGTRFLRLARRDQHVVAQFIVQLERERLKVRPPGTREG